MRNGMKELLAASVIPKLRFLPQLLAQPKLCFSLLDGGLPCTNKVGLKTPRHTWFNSGLFWAFALVIAAVAFLVQ